MPTTTVTRLRDAIARGDQSEVLGGAHLHRDRGRADAVCLFDTCKDCGCNGDCRCDVECRRDCDCVGHCSCDTECPDESCRRN